jgi:SAM-dependent methyltransferase
MTEEFDQHYTDYQTNRSALRKWVRRAYLRSAARQVQGRTLDFGCGVGELLEKLPAGSKGLEYNLATVAYCKQLGLDVEAYDGFIDDWSLSVLPPGERFESMVISHVLEHLDAPVQVLNRLLKAGQRLGIRRVLVIVPGQAGFKIDATHVTFVDRNMLCGAEVLADTGFVVDAAHYFPGNISGIGDWFPHHELQVVYVRG